MLWDALTALATTVSMVAFVLTAVYIREQLKGLEKDRYLNITSELFTVWQGREFMEAQLWLVHRLEQNTWQAFVAAHRGDAGEVAFHRVGSFYDRVGTLVRLGFVNDQEILSTIGGYAIAVWQKIEPLVREARRIENSTLFANFERLLPACHECYVPGLSSHGMVVPFAVEQPVPKTGPDELKKRLDAGEELTVLDVRNPSQRAYDPRELPRAVALSLDELEIRVSELPEGIEVVAYCACPNDASSVRAAEVLRERGYRASALRGGLDAWARAGYPVHSNGAVALS